LATLTLAFKGKTLQVFPLLDGLVTIGRDDGCDIQIDSLAIEPQHARLVARNNIFTLTQGKHNNTIYLNHKSIGEQVLKHNDILRIGKHSLIFREDSVDTSNTEQIDSAVTMNPPSEAAELANNTGWLQVMNGRMLGKTFKLRSGLTDLGKLGMLPALIALRRSGYFISNLADADTLSVADHNIGNGSHPLQDGDLIKLGKLTLQFHLHS